MMRRHTPASLEHCGDDGQETLRDHSPVSVHGASVSAMSKLCRHTLILEKIAYGRFHGAVIIGVDHHGIPSSGEVSYPV